MSRERKVVNNTNIPDHEIEKLARCFLPDIIAFFESEEGQRAYAAYLAKIKAVKNHRDPS